MFKYNKRLMKFTPYLYIVPLALLAACSSEEQINVAPDAGKGNGAIELSAGIVEGEQSAVTRAGAEDHHTTPGHLNLTKDTKLALRVSGTWKGHSPVDVVAYTTGTIGDKTGTGNLHNAVTCSPVLYWDDYGSADPSNMSPVEENGRDKGLTIYGVAINGKKDAAPSVTDAQWTSGLPWTLDADQSSGFSAKDLLISNNVKADGIEGTYKFAERASGKLLEFTHAMSKITVNLKAGAGFNDAFTSTTVTLTSNKTGESNDEWAYTTGTVDVTSGTVSSQNNLAVITMADAASVTADYHATKEALVMPGSQFISDAAVIAKIVADGNIYYVDAEKIRTKINSSTHATDGAYSTEAGKNYILNVIVNKTDIVVTATITNWIPVEAESVSPVINVAGNYGTAGAGATTNSFSFFRSTSLDNGYSAELTTPKENGYYKPSSTVSYSSGWSMSPTLYWPDHQTHYQFRGVYPTTVTTEGVGVISSPRVEDGTDTSSGYQVIKVKNVAYDDGTFPSDLAIARPEIDASTKCESTEHTQQSLYNVGICATEGTITMNFRYMMSKVEVNLSTSDGSLHDNVDLSHAKVDIVNVYNTGDVKLGDRTVFLTGSTGEHQITYTYNSGTKTGTGISAIVPQALTYTDAQADGNVKFRITIKDGGGNVKDVYYADVAPIKEKDKTTLVAPGPNDGAKTDAAQAIWQAGYYYKYNLHLTKTQIKVTATLADWKEVTAEENVWF